MTKDARYDSSKIDINELLSKNRRESKIHSTPQVAPQGEAKQTGQTRLPPQAMIRRLSVGEYVAVASMLFASVVLFLLSLPKILYNLTTDFQPLDFLLHVFYLMLGIGTFSGALLLLRKETYLEHLADETFEDVVYQRLEPVLKDVSEVQIDLQEVRSQLHLMNLNLEKLQSRREQAGEHHAAVTVTTNYIKYIILVNITLAVFLFMLTYPLSYIPYAVTLIYLLWWAVITAEHRLWSLDAAWLWIFIPILTLPVYTIIMSAYLLDYQLFGSLFLGSLFLGLVIYIAAYYTWANYLLRGILPPELDAAVQEIKKRLQQQKQQHRKKQTPIVQERISLLNLEHIDVDLLRTALISLACLFFAVVWFGYALEHQLIGGAGWQTLGITDFHWRPLYSYGLSLLGILLLALTVIIARGQKT